MIRMGKEHLRLSDTDRLLHLGRGPDWSIAPSARRPERSARLVLAVLRLMLAELLEHDDGQQAWAGASPEDNMEWCWRLADLLAVAAGERQNVSRIASLPQTSAVAGLCPPPEAARLGRRAYYFP